MQSHNKIDPSWLPQVPDILYINGLSECEFWKTLKFEKSDVIYAVINDKKDIQTKNVENRKKMKKYLTFNLITDLGIKIKKENNVDKHKEEKPINEIIYNLFSIDCFFLILFL